MKKKRNLKTSGKAVVAVNSIRYKKTVSLLDFAKYDNTKRTSLIQAESVFYCKKLLIKRLLRLYLYRKQATQN